MQSGTSRRGLSTARAALQVAWLLAARPQGIRADDVAQELGKSVSTAYNLLVSLCDEGVAVHHAGGLYRLAPAFGESVTRATTTPTDDLPDLSGVVAELLARTHKRSYLGVMRAGELHVVRERGSQGMAKLPGLGAHITDNAHALAIGKVTLAMAPPEVVERYVQAGLRRFSAHTIIDPDAVRDELREVRRRGFAVDCEEFDEDFCCIAAPVLDAKGRFLAAIGISMTRRAFDDEHETLARTVVGVALAAGARAGAGLPAGRLSAYDIARFQASSETAPVLDPPADAAVAWPRGTPVP
ncbi:MAG TPA: IclR family transcriptional regulator C-terminal domain-containing protein [Solirubrobacteraceae bacterium]|nr:IclR family transcriptional regulator C-terminal domain-containing protein [Solirubrobacteraceae bacterium]